MLDQKCVQQNSEILMLEAELQTSKKQFEQLSGIHSKCRSQIEKVSVGIQTGDEVALTLEKVSVGIQTDDEVALTLEKGSVGIQTDDEVALTL